MACFIVSARAHPVVEARTSTATIVIKAGGVIVSLSPEEATQLCKDLAHAAMALSRTARARRGMVPAGGIELARGNTDLVEVAA
ncbi:hypothetical protein [Stenotrophomonas rhizophila]|uniref:hypothetical protein n=1 Tax=Stenotrophomonas rhizophila TaxID=216778 RepID=UPI0028A8F8B3|nr:hypothetical protein [Stenotrophomonas rhizophila]